ncbi:hypothetical protein QZH41_011454 [Actinostola sp. cb2023]|nr:hypothetical protein QZH41_011454 [Actinostola sp. cb2023]
MLDKSNSCFYGLRKILDSEMKEVHMQGITNMKEEKKPFTDEEEDRMWKEGVLGLKSAKKNLMHSLYYYNGKLFGLRTGKHSIPFFHY